MKELLGYGEMILLLSPLFLFIIAVGFRLLDNSAYLFLQKEIIINSSYVSLHVLREEAENTTDPSFRKKLERMMLYRKLHRLFLWLMIPAFFATLITYTLLF